MVKIIQYAAGVFNFLVGGLYFPRFNYITKTIRIEDVHVGTRIFGICFCLWPKNDYSSKELSSLEIHIETNNDPKMANVVITSSILGVTKVNHLTTVTKGMDYDIAFHLSAYDTNGRVTIKVEICPARAYNPTSLHFDLPRSKYGYTYT